jgi:hypothetical protein
MTAFHKADSQFPLLGTQPVIVMVGSQALIRRLLSISAIAYPPVFGLTATKTIRR